MNLYCFLLFIHALLAYLGLKECKIFSKEYKSELCNARSLGNFDKSEDWTIYTSMERGHIARIIRMTEVKDSKMRKRLLNSSKLMTELAGFKLIPQLDFYMEVSEVYAEVFKNFDISGIDLFTYTTKGKMLSNKEIMQTIETIVEGLINIYKKSIVLTEKSFESIIEGGKEKKFFIFTSLGEAAKVGDKIEVEGNFKYWTLDRLEGKQQVFTIQSDIYAFGVYLYRLFHNSKFPFAGETIEEYKANVKKGDYEIKAFLSNETSLLIHLMLQTNAGNRPDIEAIQSALKFISSTDSKEQNEISASLKLNNAVSLNEEMKANTKPEFQYLLRKFITIDESKETKETDEFDDENQTKWIFYAIGGVILVIICIFVLMSLCRKNEDDQREKAAVDADLQTRTAPLDGTEGQAGKVQQEGANKELIVEHKF